MNTSPDQTTSPNETTSKTSSPLGKPYDISFPVIACLFIFMGVDSLIDQEWIEGAGWLGTTLGLFVLVASKPMTNENWNQPRYLLGLAIFTVGISLVLCAPRHHTKPEHTVLRPADAPAPTHANP